jgi:16S rRNA (cytosine967-C5)-methyltransferase
VRFRTGGGFHPNAPPSLADSQQRRLYANLLRGMVRHLRFLETEAARFSRRDASELSWPVMAALVLGLYQVLVLRQADHAAVFETVELMGALGQPRAKGLVNAVLRSALRERGSAGESVTEPSARLATPSLARRTSHPDWLVERWVQRYGAGEAERICEANNRYESSGVRVNLARTTREALIERLSREGVTAVPHPGLSSALLVSRLGALLDSPAFGEGLCYVQDLGSQAAAAWIAPLAHGWILDACCAPGGKLTHLLELAAIPGLALKIVGMDASRERLRRVRENLARLRLPPVPLLAGNAARLPLRLGAPSGGWNAVLLDVPCSATGMIRKYPELKWNKHAEDVARHVALQAELLDQAAQAVRPGGLIAYLTCSLEPEENERQVEAFLARARGFRRRSFRDLPPPPGLSGSVDDLVTPSGDLLILPREDRMGLFAALLQRSDESEGVA